jgi:hypothetical protein
MIRNFRLVLSLLCLFVLLALADATLTGRGLNRVLKANLTQAPPLAAASTFGPVNIGLTRDSATSIGETSNGDIKGAVNVMSFGAKCDGVTNDNEAFRNATYAAFASSVNGNTLVVPATGDSCIVNQWDLTNHFGHAGLKSASIHVIGQSGTNGLQASIECIESKANSGNCIDLSGSDFVTIENLYIKGGSSSGNAPRTSILLAQTKNDLKYTEGFYFRNVTVSTYGQFALYSYGGEIMRCENCNFSYAGPVRSHGEALIMLSTSNTRGIASSFQAIQTGWESMTQVFFDEGTVLSCGALTGACVELDNNTFGSGGYNSISNISLSGYANLGSDSPRAFLSDLSPNGELHNIHMIGMRVEAENARDQLAVLHSNGIKGFEVDGTFADSSVPAVPEIVFASTTGGIGEGSVINLQPGDVQSNYPGGTSPIAVVSCAGKVWGLVIYDRNKYGGGNTPNACPGAIEIPGAGRSNWSVDGSGNFNIPGNLNVGGTISKGAGGFKIDHPLDPGNKYLHHSFVESPDMMDVYNGNVTTNNSGLAAVALPGYFEALNRDFRYQLTPIGQFAQAMVAEEIKGNRFLIKTSKPNVKVSWQVTGIRHDAYADAHRIPTEEMKPSVEQANPSHQPPR